MRYWKWLALTPMVLLWYSSDAGEIPADVDSAVQNEFRLFLKDVRMYQEAESRYLGVDIHKVRLGEPIKCYVSLSEYRRQYKPGDPIDKIINRSHFEWMFPVWHEDQVIAHITMAKGDDGKWNLNSYGSGSLSVQLGYLVASWPRSKGHTPFLVHMLSWEKGTGLFYSLPHRGNRNLTPITVDGDWGRLWFLTSKQEQKELARGPGLLRPKLWPKYRSVSGISAIMGEGETGTPARQLSIDNGPVYGSMPCVRTPLRRRPGVE